MACIGGCNVEANFTIQRYYRYGRDFRILYVGRSAEYSLLREEGWRCIVHIGRQVSLPKWLREPIENGMPQVSAVNDFVVELLRAANEMERISSFEKMRLLDRAVTTIRDMREAIGIPASGMGTDAAVDLQTVSALVKAGVAQNDTIRAALLDAAGMIRDLHIVLDTKTEILFEDGSQ